MLRPWQFRDRTCAKLKVPTTQLMENKHHRVLNGTQDEVIMKKWNLNWQYFTLKIGCFPSSTFQNSKPQSKFHVYELCLHIIRIRIAYWRSMVCSGHRWARFGVTMTFHVLLKMAVWHPHMQEISEIYCTSYVHTATKLRPSVVIIWDTSISLSIAFSMTEQLSNKPTFTLLLHLRIL